MLRWHRFWVRRWEWKRVRAEHRLVYHRDMLVLLTPDPQIPAWVAEPTPTMWDNATLEVTGPLQIHAEPMVGLFTSSVVDYETGEPIALDAPDSPEADHLFWEESASEMLQRLDEQDNG
jgi:hypothetical protein